MPRHHHRAGGAYPTYQNTVGTGESGPTGDGGMFESQPDLGGFGAEGSGGGGMPSINIYNTAIAQAIAEQGPGGVSPGPITAGGGGGGHHHHQTGGHHGGGSHHHH